jgi:predicted O-methyltransferase YrrM
MPQPQSLTEADALLDAQLTSLPGWCDYVKAKRLLRVAVQAAALGGTRGVELGVYGGRSLIALALGYQLAGRGTVIGIDSWSKDDCLEGQQSDVDRQLWGRDTDYEALVLHTQDGIRRFGVADIARIVRKRTADAVSDFPDESIDLMHLDSNHSELTSCRDVESWLPKMAKTATWIADDTNWPSMQRALRILEGAGFARVETGPADFWAVYQR